MAADPAGLPVAVTDPLGNTTTYTRDGLGSVVAVTDPLGQRTSLQWTVEGQLAARTGPDGTSETWEYDGEGNLVEHTDPLGQVTRIQIGPFDLPVSRTDPMGRRTEYTYDTELRLTAVTVPGGGRWQYTYDAAGRMLTETDVNGLTWSYTPDAAGQVVARTAPDGTVTRCRRDDNGAITEVIAPDGTTVFSYDPVGQLVRAVNADADLALERDPMGRVVAETCNGRRLASAFDSAGQRVGRRTPTGAQTHWEYTPNGRPAAVATAGHLIGFAYDAAGREVERSFGAARLASTWDANSQLAAQNLVGAGSPAAPPSGPQSGPAAGSGARLLHRRAYTYRPDGNPVGVEDSVTGTRRFDLDAIGRITAVHGSTGTERYTYDPAGNITAATWPGGGGGAGGNAVAPGPPAYGDAAGDREYTGTLLRRAGNIRYEYDARGRVVLRQHKPLTGRTRTWHFTWDSRDQLVAVLTPDRQRWQYTYDALGRRISKLHVDGDGAVIERIDFTWDGQVLAEQVRTSWIPGVGTPFAQQTTTWEHDPTDERPVAQTDRRSRLRDALRDAPQAEIDERFHAIVTDLVGTPAHLVSGDGDLAWSARATFWGHGQPAPQPGTVDCPLRFPGQYADDETGLNYNHFRHYEPATARYATPDPLGLEASPNPYGYVPNPTTEIDPHGLAPCTALRPGGHIVGDIAPHGILSPGVNRAVGQTNTAVDRFVQSHHIIQDAWATRNGIAGYARDDAPAILLQSARGDAHALISAAQRARRVAVGYATTIQDEFRASYQQLVGAGVPQATAQKAINEAYKYFHSIGAI